MRAHEGGLLQYQVIDGEEYPPYLYEGGRSGSTRSPSCATGDHRRPAASALRRRQRHGQPAARVRDDERPVPAGAQSHRAGAPEEYGWDDERVFQTTRNILTVILIKIVVEEYINHISPYHLKLLADPSGFRNPRWYRQNWMAIEFNLLYRWHSLVPSSFRIGDRDVGVSETLFNTDILIERRPRRLLRGCVEPACRARRPLQLPARGVAGRGGEHPPGPRCELRPYNEYRRLARFPRAAAVRRRVERPARAAGPAGRLRRRRRDRALPRPVRRGRPAQRRAARR